MSQPRESTDSGYSDKESLIGVNRVQTVVRNSSSYAPWPLTAPISSSTTSLSLSTSLSSSSIDSGNSYGSSIIKCSLSPSSIKCTINRRNLKLTLKGLLVALNVIQIVMSVFILNNILLPSNIGLHPQFHFIPLSVISVSLIGVCAAVKRHPVALCVYAGLVTIPLIFIFAIMSSVDRAFVNLRLAAAAEHSILTAVDSSDSLNEPEQNHRLTALIMGCPIVGSIVIALTLAKIS